MNALGGAICISVQKDLGNDYVVQIRLVNKIINRIIITSFESEYRWQGLGTSHYLHKVEGSLQLTISMNYL